MNWLQVLLFSTDCIFPSPVGSRIHWLLLCIVVRPPPTNECPRYDTKQSDGESDAGALGKAEYPFIVIAPRSTLVRSGNTW